MAFLGNIVDFVRPLASNIVVAVVILLIGVIIAKLLERLVQKIMHELEVDNVLKKAGIEFPLSQTTASFIRYVIYLIAIVIALNQINITGVVLNLIAMAILIMVIVSILLGLKDFFPNFVAGIRIHKRGIKLGDILRVRNMHGEVVQVNLLDIRIKTDTGDILFVPNSLLTKNEILQYKRKKSKKSKK